MKRQGLFDQALHLLTLENSRFRQFSFDQECRRNHFAANPQRRNVFIAGMARAGSTALLNAIFASGQFAATTYALMPFALAPSLANRMSSLYHGQVTPVERFQGDSIRVSKESPEALDGIFWSTYFPTLSETVQPHQVPSNILEKYAMHIENQLTFASARRYLCKMNQSIDKLESLANYFTHSSFLIPFRNPLQQAMSLLRQHHRFSNLSWYDKRYMKWQQHYEFGDLHRGFGIAAAKQEPESLNYWLRQWQTVHQYLSELAQRYDNLIPLRYESITTSLNVRQQLSRRLDTELEMDSHKNQNREHPAADENLEPALLDSCSQLYDELSNQFETRLCA